MCKNFTPLLLAIIVLAGIRSIRFAMAKEVIMNRKRCRRLAFLQIGFIVVLGGIGVLCAQEGTISGRVTDPAGGVVPDVTVTATNLGTGIRVPTVTNDTGRYVLALL